MDAVAEEFCGLQRSRPRTVSNASQQSQQSSKQNFPLMTNDSGLYTCSSNTSDCSIQLESDTDSSHQFKKFSVIRDESLQLALQDVRKLRSELERLSKSEQWYKQELRQQKSTRLDDLERIYTQERKFMQENQRLQKECVRLYEKCNDLEKELEKQNQATNDGYRVIHEVDEKDLENIMQFEKEQQMALIKDQQQLIVVLRKQKRSLLEDLRSLTEEKDEKVMDLQRLLADMEFDNKRITKKCKQYAKERVNLENNLKQSDSKLSLTLQEKMNLQKSIVDLREKFEIQQQLLNVKEKEIEHVQQHFTYKIQEERNLDEVHKLSIKYQEEINNKTLEIINLKGRLHEMQDEIEDLQKLQQQNDEQQRQIEQLNFTLETYQVELQELKASEEHKNQQLDDLQISLDEMLKDKEIMFKTTVEQQNDLMRTKQALKTLQEQYEQVQELYKKTQFKLEMLEIEQAKVKFQNEKDYQEIDYLRNKLKEYLQQTTDLSNKIKVLQAELDKTLKENVQIKQNTGEMTKIIQQLEENAAKSKNQQRKLHDLLEKQQKENLEKEQDHLHDNDEDFLKLQQQCNKLQHKLDFLKDDTTYSQIVNDFINNLEETQKADVNKSLTLDSANKNSEQDADILNITHQGFKLQENLDVLKEFIEEKQHLLFNLNHLQHSNEGMKKLVNENEILKQKLNETETEANTLQLQQNINEKTHNCTKIQEILQHQVKKIENLRENLLKNDAKLYKIQRKLQILHETDKKLKELQEENAKLKIQLLQEQTSKTDLEKKLIQETERLKNLKQTLVEIKRKQKSTKHQAVQCVLEENSSNEVKDLKENIEYLQQQQSNFLQQEAHNKEQRLKLLRKMLDLQNNKIQSIQQQQQDWDDMLKSLNKATTLEEKTRHELELKRRELEELNQVFAEQNEELRKLEEFTELLELKRQQEKEHLKLTFQQEINVMKQQLQQCQQEIEQQKLTNQQLELQNERLQQDIKEDYAVEKVNYKKEITELKSRVNSIMQEKEDLLQQLSEEKKQTKQLKDHKREAIFMPDLSLHKVPDISIENSIEKVANLKQTISEDHLRILTKVLEAEYQRKMQRYDEHIHSLLSNLKVLKKSLKANEEKTALLSQEQLQTKEELKDLQITKRGLEEMRLKYEQSQNTIKELKQALTYERKKFDLSDMGKSAQSNSPTYEVANLIDDYKKLIQQSALATKRPTTSAILELIQRSNQCVPNLQKLETNVDGLRSELHNFLSSYTHNLPASTLIATASLTVPPSLMDELRAASDGF